ncbi:MAG: TIGR00730 family Rossman fold protein, partial [Dehalococcoidia bacterium]|nr:TIGR00730 family Rossman fold protein [Dehalococcoidia bacterium]
MSTGGPLSSQPELTVAVFCGSSAGQRRQHLEAAREAGRELARLGVTVVYGGASVGLMGALADACLVAGGRVIGVIPRLLVDLELAHTGLTELHVVETMAERKALMAGLADGFLVLPGAYGTLDEAFEMVTWRQLGLHAGPLVFALVVVAVFQAIFSGARPLMAGVELLVERSGAWVAAALPDSAFRDLLVEGVWGGVGSVVVFLPQILLLFLFLGILEDSGYLARSALFADRTMAKVGLQGKSFIPLLSAYACAVPAIMSTRTIENKRDRIATILIAPFMTCSARLPVYTLIIAAFIPERPLLGGLLGTRAAAMLGLYALGFLAAIATARLLKSSILKSERTPFVLEMPPYRWPTPASLGLRLYDRAKLFLRRAGTVILAVAIVLWTLAHLPLVGGAPPPIQDSVAGTVGRAIEPLIEQLGFNWKIGIGLVTSLAAREVIVGTLGTIYGIEGDENSAGLAEALQRD